VFNDLECSTWAMEQMDGGSGCGFIFFNFEGGGRASLLRYAVGGSAAVGGLLLV